MGERRRQPASGERHSLVADGYRAEIAGVGATLRSLRFAGRDLIAPFDAARMRPAMSGALLAPWPNRTADGRYAFHGVSHQLAVNEIATGNAAHGLVAWLDFEPVSISDTAVALTADIVPQPGYPWRIRLDVAFRLGSTGFSQEVVATNLGDTLAPFGMGAHPYLVAGAVGPRAIDGWDLTVPAERVLLTSNDRMLPIGAADVGTHDDGHFDFRRPRSLRGHVLNHAYTQLVRDEQGMAVVRVTDSSGTGTEIEVDSACRWLQIYTADASSGDSLRHAVAVEPMTCPPDALNSGLDLLEIEPGQSASASWTIRAVR